MKTEEEIILMVARVAYALDDEAQLYFVREVFDLEKLGVRHFNVQQIWQGRVLGRPVRRMPDGSWHSLNSDVTFVEWRSVQIPPDDTALRAAVDNFPSSKYLMSELDRQLCRKAEIVVRDSYRVPPSDKLEMYNLGNNGPWLEFCFLRVKDSMGMFYYVRCQGTDDPDDRWEYLEFGIHTRWRVYIA